MRRKNLTFMCLIAIFLASVLIRPATAADICDCLLVAKEGVMTEKNVTLEFPGVETTNGEITKEDGALEETASGEVTPEESVTEEINSDESDINSSTENEHHGLIRYLFGYGWLMHYLYDYDTETGDFYHLGPLPFTAYDVAVSGRFANEYHELVYDISKQPDEESEIYLDWTNPIGAVQYDKAIKLTYPELRLAFGRNQINGLEAHTTDKELAIFSGKENYIPVSKIFPIKSSNVKEFALYSVPSSGDIVENSEVVMLDGRLLKKMQDYHLNYLSGKLQLHIPVERGMTLEVKFLFVITDEDLLEAEERETLTREKLLGAYYLHRWEENHLGAFYFHRGTNVNQVGGFVGRYANGPLCLEGEWAVSKEQNSSEPHYAYELRGNYADEIVSLTYEVRNIEPDFTEIGVNAYTSGKGSSFVGSYRGEENMEFFVEMSNHEVTEGQDIVATSLKKGGVDLKLTKHQSAQLIFEHTDRSWNTSTHSAEDIIIGYTLKTQPLSISLGQSLQTAEDRFAKLTVNLERFRILADYQIEEKKNDKEHQANAEVTFRPTDQLDLNTIVQFTRPLTPPLFGEIENKWRVNVNANWFPVDRFSVNSGFVYFNNSKDSYVRRYIGGLNYASADWNTNLNVMNSRLETFANQTDDQDINWSVGVPLWKYYQLTYQILHTAMREYNKVAQEVNLESQNHQQTAKLSYTFHENHTVHTGIGYTKEGFGVVDIWDDKETYQANLGYNYSTGIGREISLEAEYGQEDENTFAGMTSRFKYPLGTVELDCLGVLNYQLNDKSLGSAKGEFNLVLPTIGKVTPTLGYGMTYNALDGEKSRQEKALVKLQYHWKEKQSIFLQSNWEQLIDWKKPSNSYADTFLYTGIQIEY